ncbi:aldehyde dehydrogenase family protein [uncultured Desulfobacter sp.]|uniref:aldehyde dehydrogenase family protein n=1 Tax=uncultured Desulfobacter sp. TaxID=240139 RepID=UPI002AAB9408|nr:aldehyde dehydrogenase family protein [uncultured Desulfobacter sp.]
MTEYALVINGEKVVTRETFDVINPATGEVFAVCPRATVEQLDQAVAAARNALPAWSALADEKRVEYLLQIAGIIEKNMPELSRLITLEQGKTQSGPGANFEVGGCMAWTQVTASLKLENELIDDNPEDTIELTRKPVGVVGSITPWNWPLLIAVWHIMPALRVGCTVVIKPASYTPLSTLRMVELINDILPPGVLNVVAGSSEIGNAMSAHKGIDKMVFTGSVEVGQTIMQRAATTLKTLTLELGGNDAGIILPGTDIEPLLEPLFWGCFINAGQTCACLKRLFVHEDQYEDVCRKFADYVSKIPVGDGMNEANLIGPLANAAQFNLIRQYVDDARDKGARVLCGGEPMPGKGYFYPLTLVADVTDDMDLVKEEQFGTALPILKYSTIDEAVARANAVDVGLGGSAWGNDVQQAKAVAQRLEAGTVWINAHGKVHPLAPFGGVKLSGIGTEFGVEGLKAYTTIQVVSVAKPAKK